MLKYELLCSSNYKEVKELIIAGLAEHFHPEQYQESFNPDIMEIQSHYDGNKAFMYIGRRADGELVASGALEIIDKETVEVRRVSVKTKYRHLGLGKEVMDFLEDQAGQMGFKRIILETMESWDKVVGFYLKCGYTITHREKGDVFFEKILLI